MLNSLNDLFHFTYLSGVTKFWNSAREWLKFHFHLWNETVCKQAYFIPPVQANQSSKKTISMAKFILFFSYSKQKDFQTIYILESWKSVLLVCETAYCVGCIFFIVMIDNMHIVRLGVLFCPKAYFKFMFGK